MHVTLEPVAFGEKPVLRRLMQLYLHDMSEFTADDIGEHGEFDYRYLDHYWAPDAGEERHPLFIRADGPIAGFALVRKSAGDDEWQMAEFFVMRRFRRTGVGKRAATMVFQRFPGRWFVHELERNTPAQVFWPRVIDALTGGGFEQGTDDDGAWQRFTV